MSRFRSELLRELDARGFIHQVTDAEALDAQAAEGRVVARPLQPVEQHDRDQVADVQAVGRAVEPDIAHHPPVGRERVERRLVGALVDEAARVELPQELGPEPAHR